MITWMLVLMAVNIHNVKDQPAYVRIPFDTESECRRALDGLEYWVKFKDYTVVGSCQKLLSS